MTRKLIALLLLAALSLAGCGRGLGAKALSSADINALPPAELIVASRTKTANAGTFHARFDFTVTGLGVEGVDAEFAFEGEGAFDLDNERASVRFTVPELPALPGEAALMDGGFEMVVDGSDMYMRLSPALQRLMSSTTEWMRIPGGSLGSLPGGLAGGMPMMGPTNATDPLGALEQLGGVARTGREEVAGVATTRYSGQIDLEGMSGNLFGAAQAAILDDFGPIRYDVWIDDDGLLRRMAARMKMPSGPDLFSGAPATGENAEMIFGVELYDFGTPVTVQVPDPKDVSELSDLMNLGPPTL